MIPVTYTESMDNRIRGERNMMPKKNCVFISLHIVNDDPLALIIFPEGEIRLVALISIKAQVNNSGIVTPQTSFR